MRASHLWHFTPKDESRFWSFVHEEPNTGCWLWEGTIGRRQGLPYIANFALHSRPVQAQSVAWFLARGPLLPGQQLQRCVAMGIYCVNPDHQRARPIRRGRMAMPRRGRVQQLRELSVELCRGVPVEVLELLSSAGIGLSALIAGSRDESFVAHLAAAQALLPERRPKCTS